MTTDRLAGLAFTGVSLQAGHHDQPGRVQGWAVPADRPGCQPESTHTASGATSQHSWASLNLTVPGHFAEASASHLSVFPSFPLEMSSLSNITREGDSKKGGENSLDYVH